MESKSKRIPLSKADAYLEKHEAFGWQLVSKDDLRPDNTIVLTLQRDKENFQNYGKIKKLEKQYRVASRVIPVPAIINAIIGGGLLAAYLFTKTTLVFAVAFLYGALTFFSVALFALVIFIIMFLNRGKILRAIIKEAGQKSVSDQDLPTPRNVAPETETTWAIYQSMNNSQQNEQQ